MPRSNRATCVGCGERRVLYGGICRACMDQEEFGRTIDQHQGDPHTADAAPRQEGGLIGRLSA